MLASSMEEEINSLARFCIYGRNTGRSLRKGSRLGFNSWFLLSVAINLVEQWVCVVVMKCCDFIHKLYESFG